MRISLCDLALSILLGVLAATDVSAATVIVVSSERGAAYAEAAQAMIGELEKRGLPRREVLDITAAEWPLAKPSGASLIVALGARATEVMAQAEVSSPVLCTLLPRASFERALQAFRRRVSARFSALYLDQPLDRHFDLIRLALPDARRVGVLLGPASPERPLALRVLAQSRGLSVVDATVDAQGPIFPALKEAMQDVDVLLALPDPLVYNNNTIQNILLASMRAKVPIAAFSPAYVRAGALLALYTTPTQIGVQAAAIASSVLKGGELPGTPLYPQDFDVAVNEHIASSMLLNLNAKVLKEQLHKKGATP
jgi:putative tryptophan/tyrosine transport system substrate-binding protein